MSALSKLKQLSDSIAQTGRTREQNINAALEWLEQMELYIAELNPGVITVRRVMGNKYGELIVHAGVVEIKRWHIHTNGEKPPTLTQTKVVNALNKAMERLGK